MMDMDPEEILMEEKIRKLKGANMDIDLATEEGEISWEQDRCPWNEERDTVVHKCAVKGVYICPYFCGVVYLDSILCCYPNLNPLKEETDEN
jgi:hypothetical protein